MRQWRFLSYVLSPAEQRRVIASLVTGCLLLFIGAGLLIEPHITTLPTAGGTLSEGLVGSPKLINPLYADLNDVDRDLSRLVFASLFRLAPNRIEPVPDLAERYRWLPDNKTLEVTIRSDARFHDGSPLSADDVVFTYSAAKSAAWRSPWSSVLKDVGVVRVDEQTIQFQFPSYSLTAYEKLTLGILPAHIWEEVTPQNGMLAEANIKPVGAGPYQFSQFTRDTKGAPFTYTVKRFPLYHGEQPLIEERIFRFYGDHEQAVQGIKNNQIESLAFVPWKEAETLRVTDRYEVQLDLPQVTTVFFQMDDPTLKDLSVRRALQNATYAILSDEWGTNATRSSSPFPFVSFVTSSTAPDVALKDARDLLNSAGWITVENDPIRHKQVSAPTRGTNTTSTTPQPKLLLHILVSHQPDLISVAELLKREWSLIGAEVTIETVEASDLRQRLTNGEDYQIVVTNLFLPRTTDLEAFFDPSGKAGSGINISGYSNKTLTSAFDRLEVATSSFALSEAQKEIARVLNADIPALFLLQPSYAYILPNDVKGQRQLRLHTPSDRFFPTSPWYLKSKWVWK